MREQVLARTLAQGSVLHHPGSFSTPKQAVVIASALTGAASMTKLKAFAASEREPNAESSARSDSSIAELEASSSGATSCQASHICIINTRLKSFTLPHR